MVSNISGSTTSIEGQQQATKSPAQPAPFFKVWTAAPALLLPAPARPALASLQTALPCELDIAKYENAASPCVGVQSQGNGQQK